MRNGCTAALLRAAGAACGVASGELTGFDVKSVSACGNTLVRAGRLVKVGGRFYTSTPAGAEVALPRVPLTTSRVDHAYVHRPGSLDHRQHPSRFGNTLRYPDGRVEGTLHATEKQA